MNQGTSKSVEPRLERANAEQGICCTCNYRPDCINLKAAGFQPIWYCSQFDTHVPKLEQTLLDVSREVEAPTAGSAASNALAGLCSDCEASNDCIYQIPGVNKVYCEQYR